MPGYGFRRAFARWRCKTEKPGGLLLKGHTGFGTVLGALLLFTLVLRGEEGTWQPFDARLTTGSIAWPIPAAALHAERAREPVETGTRQLLAVAAGAAHAGQGEQPPSYQLQVDARLPSLGYWTAEEGSAGETIFEAYSVVEAGENAALHLTPSQLQSITQLVRNAKRERIVEDENLFRDKRFQSFAAGLQGFAQATFRPFTSARAEKLNFKKSSRQCVQDLATPKEASSNVASDHRRDEYQIERVQLLEAVRGRFATKVTVLLGGADTPWNTAHDSAACLGKKCGAAPKQVSGLAISLADPVGCAQRKPTGSHRMLQGFVSEVKGGLTDAELEKELRWELHIWNYLPAWRAAELAEEHILIPMNLLRHEVQTVALEDSDVSTTLPQSSVAKGDPDPAQRDSTFDPPQNPRGPGRAGHKGLATKLDRLQEHKWSDRLSESVYNVFIYYPRGYRNTIATTVIPSDQISENWYRTATTDFLLSISTQMILAVANFNSYGLVHTHIRPSSFVLDLDGIVLLSDLNRAVAAGETMDCLSDRITGVNDLTASPEESACIYKYAWNFEEHDDRKERIVGPMQAEFPVDSWRLGVILYRLWCREPAFDRRSDHEFHLRHLKARAAGESVAADDYLEHNRLPMNYCRKDMPSSLQRVIRRMLIAEPASRLTAAEAVTGSSLFYHLRRTKNSATAEGGTGMRVSGKENA